MITQDLIEEDIDAATPRHIGTNTHIEIGTAIGTGIVVGISMLTEPSHPRMKLSISSGTRV